MTTKDETETNIYFDFEFIEDGSTITPISLGMVCGDKEFYIEYKFDPARANEWVRENVFPHLAFCPWRRDFHNPRKLTVDRSMDRPEAANHIAEWVRDVARGRPVFVGFCASYDWVCLMQHFGPMIAKPGMWPYAPYDLAQEYDNLPPGIDRGKLQPPQENEHDALADAKWNREFHRAIIRAAKNG